MTSRSYFYCEIERGKIERERDDARRREEEDGKNRKTKPCLLLGRESLIFQRWLISTRSILSNWFLNIAAALDRTEAAVYASRRHSHQFLKFSL